ncbi:oligosaccharide flippase family protein [Microbacterium pygmaeum]|nr:oligosaccharide flippase family protein [Microbacterium pygmaeum]
MFAGAAKNFLGNVVGPLAGLISAPILAHVLGAEGRGEVAGATAPLLLFATLAAFGIPEAVTYFVARDLTHRLVILRRATIITALVGLAATGAAIALAPFLSGGSQELTSLIVMASLAILPTIFVGILRATAAGLGRWSLVASERAAGPLIRLIAIIILALLAQLDVFSATLAIAYSPVIAGLIYLALPWRSGRSEEPPPSYADVTGYSARAWLGSIAGVILMRIDQVLMVPLSSTTELGLYVVAVTVSELPLVVNTAIREVVFATDARSSSDEALTRAARVSLLVCLMMGLALGLTCYWWLPVLFGAEFGAAVPVAMILLLAVVIGIPGSVAGAGLSARGLPQLRSYSLVLACVINLVIVITTVPLIGAVGAALATLAGNLISSNFNVLQMRLRFGTPFWSFYAVRRSDVSTLAARVLRLFRRG